MCIIIHCTSSTSQNYCEGQMRKRSRKCFEKCRALHKCWVLLFSNALEKFSCSSSSILYNSHLRRRPHKYFTVSLITLISAAWGDGSQASFGYRKQKPISKGPTPEMRFTGRWRGKPQKQREGRRTRASGVLLSQFPHLCQS